MATIAVVAQAENSARQISALVCDATTLEPLSDAVMSCNSALYAVDVAGRVAAVVEVGDTLCFRHVGYREAKLPVVDSLWQQSIAGIFLTKDTVLLSEVVVRPRVINISAPLNVVGTEPQSVIAQQNIRRSAYQALTQPNTSAWDSHDNQRLVQQRFNHALEYRHMIAPDETIGVGSAAIALIFNLIRQAVGSENQAVAPLSGREVEMLIKAYCPKDAQ